ncbi:MULTISPECIES: nitroreductase [unclassified Pseudonocardia]|uniref:nitroreductase n=1 Tax=unclassified Pseudonocardia TaxID=2619320 RepID=UPI0009F8DF09|nr:MULTISPECIES: nitroreductase [unclassified Pseudonocardia]
MTTTAGGARATGAGSEPAPAEDTAALARLLDGRRSCRAYLAEPLERATIEAVLDLARRTPSWCNTQPWQVMVTEGEGTDRFRGALLDHLAGQSMAPDFPFPERYEGEFDKRRKECAWQLYDAVGIEYGDRRASAAQTVKNFEFFGAPHVAIVTTEAALGTYGAVDCGLYVQSFLLAAESLGLGAIPQAALAAYSPFIRSHFGLPESRHVVCGISFGRPDVDAAANAFRTRRREVDDTVSWFSS